MVQQRQQQHKQVDGAHKLIYALPVGAHTRRRTRAPAGIRPILSLAQRTGDAKARFVSST
jgi:hypothetical protein